MDPELHERMMDLCDDLKIPANTPYFGTHRNDLKKAKSDRAMTPSPCLPVREPQYHVGFIGGFREARLLFQRSTGNVWLRFCAGY
jgi:hypothetical protein